MATYSTHIILLLILTDTALWSLTKRFTSFIQIPHATVCPLSGESSDLPRLFLETQRSVRTVGPPRLKYYETLTNPHTHNELAPSRYVGNILNNTKRNSLTFSSTRRNVWRLIRFFLRLSPLFHRLSVNIRLLSCKQTTLPSIVVVMVCFHPSWRKRRGENDRDIVVMDWFIRCCRRIHGAIRLLFYPVLLFHVRLRNNHF